MKGEGLDEMWIVSFELSMIKRMKSFDCDRIGLVSPHEVVNEEMLPTGGIVFTHCSATSSRGGLNLVRF